MSSSAREVQRRGNVSAYALSRAYAHYIQDKVVLVTGASPGSLAAAFLQAAVAGGARPALVILAGRDGNRLRETAAALVALQQPGFAPHSRLLQLDLSSLAAVRAAAATVNAWADVPHIDVLVNSAGIMAVDGYVLSADGYESQLAVNHLGPFLFTNLIADKLLRSETPRIVMVGGGGHRLSPFRFADFNFQDGEMYDKWLAYGQSKTANCLMARYLAEKFGGTHNLLAFSFHPGYVDTCLSNHIDWNKEWSQIPHNGSYLEKGKVGDPWTDTIKPWATSLVEAEKLWKLSEKLVGQEFPY
ncbi:hypothetical protein BX600DRAFT_481730 [Xylariales sp. PMI_506]|nr:hypothetical protein BX600DRAFT_481730 [Xylariales sp. PMI_506]